MLRSSFGSSCVSLLVVPHKSATWVRTKFESTWHNPTEEKLGCGFFRIRSYSGLDFDFHMEFSGGFVWALVPNFSINMPVII